MAELIPIQYRVRAARRYRIDRWMFVGVVAAAVSCGSLAYGFAWKQRQAAAFSRVNEAYREKSALIMEARNLQARRVDLAGRMEKMQNLIDDKLLLSLLRNVSSAISPADCVTYISVTAHDGSRGAGKAGDAKYLVNITGVTADNNTHADLLNRLTEVGLKSSPPLTIIPQSVRREKMNDGTVMRFQIVCEAPAPKGA